MKTPAVKGLFAAASAVALTAGVPLLAVAEDAPKPYDAIVDYVESTGTQWVDTGIKLGSTYTVALKFTCSSDGWFFGTIDGSNTGMLLQRTVLSNGDELFVILYNNGYIDRVRLTTAKAAGMEHELKIGPNGYYLDGIRMPPRSGKKTGAGVNTAYLFAAYLWNKAGCSAVRVKGCQIYDGETIVADFRPVCKDGVGRIYNLTSGTLLSTGGTGALVAGPDSAEQEFKDFTFTKDVTKMNQRLKYIESTGVQALTTDVKSGADTEMTLSYCFPHAPANEYGMMYGFSSASGGRLVRVDRRANSDFTQEWLLCINADLEKSGSVTSSPGNVNANDHVLVIRPNEYVLDGSAGTIPGTVTTTPGGTETLFSLYCDYSIKAKDGTKDISAPCGIWHNATADICGCPMRVYSYKMKKAGKLIRHLVPMRTAIGVGMWDKVENRFHPCISESADFIAGPNAPGLALIIN